MLKNNNIKGGEIQGSENVSKANEISPLQILGLIIIFVGLYFVLMALQVVPIPAKILSFFFLIGIKTHQLIFLLGLIIAIIGVGIFQKAE